MKLKTSAILIAGALFGAATLPAQANNDAMMDLLQVLRDKGTISNDDYKLLTNAAAADKEMAEADKEELKKEVETATAEMPKITTDGKLVVSDREGNWEFQPIGRVMWDAIDTDMDEMEEGGSEIEDFQGTELRRARLGFQGKIYDFGYKLEADFAGSNHSVKDAYVSYGKKFDNAVQYGVKLGQSHVPFGLNTKVSSKYMSFMDRPLFADTSWSPARESGVVGSLAADDYTWTVSAGLSNGGLSGNNSTDNNGSTLAVRGSFVPFMQDSNHMLQIGAGLLTKGGGDEFDEDQRLVSHKDDAKPVYTVFDEIDGANAYTVDALGIFGSFHTMAEYLNYEINDGQDSGGQIYDSEVSGYAIEAGYFLTGESLKWKKGYTSGISPKSKYGAWQLVARFESIEVDNDIANADIEADKFSLGVNYYPTKNTRLMLNYDKITDYKNESGLFSEEEPSALKFRAQAFW